MENYENMSMTQLVQKYENLKQVCVKLEAEINTSKTDRDKYKKDIATLENQIEGLQKKAEKDIEDVEQNYKGMFGFTITKEGKDKIDDIEKQLDKDLKQFDGKIDRLDEDLKKEEEKLADREEKIKNAKYELEKIRNEAYKFKEVQEVTKTEIAEKTEELNKPFEKLDNTFKEIVSNPFDNIQKKNKDYNNVFSVQDIVDKQKELFQEDNFISSYNNKTDDEKDKLKNEIINSAIKIYEVGDKYDDVLNEDENKMLDKINDVLGIKSKIEDIKNNKKEIEQKKEEIKTINKEIKKKQIKIKELKDEYAVGKISQQDKDDQKKDLNDQKDALDLDKNKLNDEIKDLEESNKILTDEIDKIKKDNPNEKIKQEIEDELNNNIQSKLDISELYAIERKNLEDQLHEMQYRDYNELQSLEIKEKNLPDDQKTNIYTEDMKKDIYKNGKKAIKYIMNENQDKIDALVQEIKSQENSDIELGIKKYLIRTSEINNEQIINSSKINELEDLDIKDLLEEYILDYSKLENKQDITKIKDKYETTIQKLKDEIKKLSQVKSQPNQNGPNQNQPQQGSKTQPQSQPNQTNNTKQPTKSSGEYYGPTPGNPNLNPLINLPQKQKQGFFKRMWNNIKSFGKNLNKNEPTQGNANSGRQTRPASNQNPNQTQTQGQTQSQTQNQNQNKAPQTNQKDQDQDLREMKPGELDQKMKDEIIKMFEKEIEEGVKANKKEAEKEQYIGK